MMDEWGEEGREAEDVFSARVLSIGKSKRRKIAGKDGEFGSITEHS